MASTTQNLEVGEDLRQRVARTLGLSWEMIHLDPCHIDLRSISCCGDAAGQRFFAKHYFADPYRIVSALPWKEVFGGVVASRAASDQVDMEWQATHSFRGFSQSGTVPAALAFSQSEKTIVWERVDGHRLDRLLKRSRLVSGAGECCVKALADAGRWLRTVHDASTQGTKAVDLGQWISVITDVMQRESGNSETPYQMSAREVLNATRLMISGQSVVELPVVMNHGDFTLANMIWDDEQRCLFVVDLENPAAAGPHYDLLTAIFSLRSKLLNPVISPDVIRNAERSFWESYGTVPWQLTHFVNAVAVARALWQFGPKMEARQQHGWIGALTSSVYRAIFESSLLTRCVEA
jgi:aminoglycoside phosphotransferase